MVEIKPYKTVLILSHHANIYVNSRQPLEGSWAVEIVQIWILVKKWQPSGL